MLLFLLLMAFQMGMLALQLDEERAMHMVFELKHAVNRSAHAAAQQLDEALLSQGIRSIDEELAEVHMYRYLQANLRLDSDNHPLADSPLRSPIELAVFEVINADRTFPYRYVNTTYNYDVTLQRPGVVLILRAEYPRMFRIIAPIVWTVKGTAELYP